jgi:hypothetical protein
MFIKAELGSFKSREAAEAGWRRMARDARLAGLTPAYAAVGAETRLVVGSLPSQDAVAALCVELSSLSGTCHPFVPVRAY